MLEIRFQLVSGLHASSDFLEKGLQEGVFSCKGMGRLCVNCHHPERKRTRSALYLAGDKEMSQGVTWERKAISSDDAVSGCRRNPKPPGCFAKSYFRPVGERVDNQGDTGYRQEIKAPGRLGRGGSWPLCSGLRAAP